METPFGHSKNSERGTSLVQLMISLAIFGLIGLIATAALINANTSALRGRAQLDAARDAKILARMFKKHFTIKKSGGHVECGSWAATDSYCTLSSRCTPGGSTNACRDIQIWNGEWAPLPVVGTKAQRIRYETECIPSPAPVSHLLFSSECFHGCPVGQRPRVKITIANFPPPDSTTYFPAQSILSADQRSQNSAVGAEICIDRMPGLVSVNVGIYNLNLNGTISRTRHAFSLPELTVPNGRVQLLPN